MKRVILLLFIVSACNTEGNQTIQSDPDDSLENNVVNANVVSYKLIFKEDIGWGYQIFRGTKMIINQEHIPAVQGINGFKTEADARKVAEEVQKMVEAGNDRPILSVEFLDSLGVIESAE